MISHHVPKKRIIKTLINACIQSNAIVVSQVHLFSGNATIVTQLLQLHSDKIIIFSGNTSTVSRTKYVDLCIKFSYYSCISRFLGKQL